MGVTYLRLGEPTLALEHLRMATSSTPVLTEALVNLGIVHAIQGNHDSSLFYLTRAVEQDPGSSRAWYNLSISYYAMKRSDDAILALRKSLALNQNSSAAQFLLGRILIEQGRIVEGKKLVESAARLGSGEARSYLQRRE